jgi:hypothetical protein
MKISAARKRSASVIQRVRNIKMGRFFVVVPFSKTSGDFAPSLREFVSLYHASTGVFPCNSTVV